VYNQELATRILDLLRKQYPRTLQLAEVKQSLPEFSELAGEDWVVAIYALHRAGLVSAELVFEDQSYEPVDVINATITEAGRKEGVKIEPRSVSEPPKSISELRNRQAMLGEINTLLRDNKMLSVLFIDLDGFKQVNDSQGHQAGDNCLDSVVKVVSEAILGKGKMYRYGGDEFVVSLPNFVSTEAEATAERIRAAIDRLNPGGNIKITASIGVACSGQGQFAKPEDLVDAADRAMYDSKQSGGNRVTIHAASAGSKQLLPKRTPGDIARRVEAAELSVSLRQAVSQNYIVLLKNDSDEEVSLKKLTLERNGLELSQPARPKEAEEWTLAPRSGREIAWSPAPDPVVTLQMSQSSPTSPIDIEIVVLCQILGVGKVFKRKILVAADYRNHRLDPLGSW